jgi:DnaJ-class molecular chaperone
MTAARHSPDSIPRRQGVSIGFGIGATMQKIGKKKEKCRNCEGKGLVKQGDKKVKCQRCGGTGYKPRTTESA